MSSTSQQYLLALEAAIGGGSIALFRDVSEIATFAGTSGVSRAEDLLPNIDSLLRNHAVDRRALSEIVVGAGPGSFTGIRIGIATAMGLAAALGITARLVSTLEAVAYSDQISPVVTAVLPVGRGTYCIQSFAREGQRLEARSEPRSISEGELSELPVETNPLIVNGSIYETLPLELRSRAVNAGDNLAVHIGRAVTLHDIEPVVEPLFIGKLK